MGHHRAILRDIGQAASRVVRVDKGIRHATDGLDLLRNPAEFITGILDVKCGACTHVGGVLAQLAEGAVSARIGGHPQCRAGDQAILRAARNCERASTREEAVVVIAKAHSVCPVHALRGDAEVDVVVPRHTAGNCPTPRRVCQQGAIIRVRERACRGGDARQRAFGHVIRIRRHQIARQGQGTQAPACVIA